MADRETNLSNFFETTLNGILASGATNATLTAAPTSDGTSNIAAPYFLVLDPDSAANREVILVTASSGTTLSTITRDVEGRHTTDPTHVDGTTVRMSVIKEMFEDIHDRVDADETTNAAHRGSTSNPHTVTFAQLGLLDEDNMATNSATLAASQQSVKAYVDTEVATKTSLGIVIALS
tara:strand:- start:2671 stop:3204 length:534 start_codon:yes stop_codon:yes gene_type:complete